MSSQRKVSVSVDVKEPGVNASKKADERFRHAVQRAPHAFAAMLALTIFGVVFMLIGIVLIKK